MGIIIQVFLLNLVTSVDNAVVVGGIVRKSRNLLGIALCSAVILTVMRTVLIAGVHFISKFSGLQLVLGCVILWVAIKMAMVDSDDQDRRKSSFF